MQDANWRELLRFCFARGAYRGAGADLLRSLTRGGEADTGSLFGVAERPEGMLHSALVPMGRHFCFALGSLPAVHCKARSQIQRPVKS